MTDHVEATDDGDEVIPIEAAPFEAAPFEAAPFEADPIASEGSLLCSECRAVLKTAERRRGVCMACEWDEAGDDDSSRSTPLGLEAAGFLTIGLAIFDALSSMGGSVPSFVVAVRTFLTLLLGIALCRGAIWAAGVMFVLSLLGLFMGL